MGVYRGEQGSETNRELVPRQPGDRLHSGHWERLREARERGRRAPLGLPGGEQLPELSEHVRKSPDDLD